jgi:hypothetical protein
MTTGLPRVTRSRFTIVYHTYIGISNEIHISINYRGYPTNIKTPRTITGTTGTAHCDTEFTTMHAPACRQFW